MSVKMTYNNRSNGGSHTGRVGKRPMAGSAARGARMLVLRFDRRRDAKGRRQPCHGVPQDQVREMNMTRDEMVELVRRLMNGEGEDDEVGEWLLRLKDNTCGSPIGAMIFWPNRERTAEEIVDEALMFRPTPMPPSSLFEPPAGDSE